MGNPFTNAPVSELTQEQTYQVIDTAVNAKWQGSAQELIDGVSQMCGVQISQNTADYLIAQINEKLGISRAQPLPQPAAPVQPAQLAGMPPMPNPPVPTQAAQIPTIPPELVQTPETQTPKEAFKDQVIAALRGQQIQADPDTIADLAKERGIKGVGTKTAQKWIDESGIPAAAPIAPIAPAAHTQPAAMPMPQPPVPIAQSDHIVPQYRENPQTPIETVSLRTLFIDCRKLKPAQAIPNATEILKGFIAHIESTTGAPDYRSADYQQGILGVCEQIKAAYNAGKMPGELYVNTAFWPKDIVSTLVMLYDVVIK